MKPYELMLIITPDHEENEAEALIENVKGIVEGGGNLVNVDVWGKRRLAYPIRKRSEGYYVVYVFESDPSFIARLNQALRVNEAILRHMIVLYEEDVEKLKTAQAEAAASENTDDGDTVDDTTESGEDVSETGEEEVTTTEEEVTTTEEDTADTEEDTAESV